MFDDGRAVTTFWDVFGADERWAIWFDKERRFNKFTFAISFDWVRPGLSLEL
jgi:hypothetical protein